MHVRCLGKTEQSLEHVFQCILRKLDKNLNINDVLPQLVFFILMHSASIEGYFLQDDYMKTWQNTRFTLKQHPDPDCGLRNVHIYFLRRPRKTCTNRSTTTIEY